MSNGDTRSKAGESMRPDTSVDAASPPAEAEAVGDKEFPDEGVLGTEKAFFDDGVFGAVFGDERVFGNEGVFVDEEAVVDEESPVDDESDGSADAMPGVEAMAAPTPRVTANAPMRPTYLA